MFEYRAIVENVVDGDTVDLTVDLGFRIQIRDRFRLSGINTPEVRGSEREAGLRSKEWLTNQLLGKEVTIKTEKDKRGIRPMVGSDLSQ